MTSDLDNKIKRAIYDLLKEQVDEPQEDKKDDTKNSKKREKKPSRSNAGVISTTGAFGTGGRPSKFATSAKARAAEDPKGLMNDLGITSPVSGNDLEAALKILRTAIYANPAMSEAYDGAKIGTDRVATDKEGRDLTAIKISVGKLDNKNGIRFLAHTLTAAQNAGFLDLSNGLQFARGLNTPIIIYSF